MTMIQENLSVEYKSPLQLRQALAECRQREHVSCSTNEMLDVFVKEVEKNEELASMPVKKYLGKGSSAIAFETSEGDVLKLTEGNHFPMSRPVEDFDVPIFKKGKSGKIRFYVEEKLYQHGMTDGFVEIVKDMIKSKGYRPYDIGSSDIHQIGISKEGKIYLLDPECAQYKTVFHALWSKLKMLFKHV